MQNNIEALIYKTTNNYILFIIYFEIWKSYSLKLELHIYKLYWKATKGEYFNGLCTVHRANNKTTNKTKQKETCYIYVFI